MMNEVILSAHDLSIGYRTRRSEVIVASHLTMEMRQGKIICLLGRNGCGKSTLIRTLTGMQKPLHGDVLIEGVPISSMPIRIRAQKIATVLTDAIDVPNMTVTDLVALGRFPHTALFQRQSETEKDIVRHALELVQLRDFANRKFSELSDGEKQRALIAKALAQDTPIMILDEPTSHLDTQGREEIMTLLRDLAHTTKKAILLSTHELDLAHQVADQIWQLSPSGLEIF